MFFRNLLFTIIIVTGFFAITEFILGIAGVQPLLLTEDPLVGFADNIPQFIKTTRKDGVEMYVTPKNKLNMFNFQAFPVNKSENTYRIFCLGGSTTYGRPYTDRLSFCGWLRAYLHAADPATNWEVINAGGISYASYRVARMMNELRNYQPDLFIVYSGQNEFLEQRSYDALQKLPAWVINLDARLSGTRLYSAMKRTLDALRSATNEISVKRDELSGEVDEILNHTMGPESYSRDDNLRQEVILHYRLNLIRMSKIADSADADIIYIRPVANLRDMSPFKSEHRNNMDLDTLLQWQTLYRHALQLQREGKPDEALAKFRKALRLDDRYADLHFRIGLLLFTQHHYEKAEASFIRAIEEDVAPLRILPSMQQIVTDVADAEDAPLIDFQAMLKSVYREKYGHTVFGKEYFTDHVHTSYEGYDLLGMALFNQLVTQGTAHPDALWSEVRAKAVRQQIVAGIDPQDEAMSFVSLGSVLIWAGKYREAQAMFQRALEIRGDDDFLYLRLANIAMATGVPDEALYYLKKIQSMPTVNTRLGIIMLQQEKADKAITYCEAEMQQHHESYMPHVCIAQALAKKGDFDSAQQHFERALELKPNKTVIHLQYASFLLDRQRYDEAIDHAREVLRINPADFQAHNTLAAIMLATGKLEQAGHHITEALRLQPGSDSAMHKLKQLQARRAIQRQQQAAR